MMAPTPGPCSTRSGDPWPRSPATVHTIRMASPPALPSVIPKRPLSCPARDRRAQRHGRDLPTQRDWHLQLIAKHGRIAWQKASGYTARARAEAAIGRFKRVIGDGLRSRTDERRTTEVDVAVHALNRMLELGRPSYVRVA